MWKVIGVLSDSQRKHGDQRKPVHGPMPRKVWINSGAGVRRVRNTPSNGLKRVARDMDQDSRLAVQYATWLAARDGVEIMPGNKYSVIYSGVNCRGAFQKRPRAVTFRELDGGFSILLPNWNWVPADPVCEIIADDAGEIAA